MGRSRANEIVKTAGCELVAVADPDEARGRAASADLGVPWHPSADELLARRDVDVVGVWTPTGLHRDLVQAAARAGKHVITTKPMEVTTERCDEMIAACRDAGVVLAVDFGYRYDPVMRQVAAAVHEGRLGRPFLIDFRLKWHRPREYFAPGGWRGTWRYDGGGSMMNQGVHYIDLLWWFFGPVRSVKGHMARVVHDIETEDLAAAILVFENGAVGVAESTTAAEPDMGTRIELHGTEGSIALDLDVALWKVAEETAPPESVACRPANVFEDVVMVLRGERRRPTVDGADGRRSVEIITAIYESARTDRTLVLS